MKRLLLLALGLLATSPAFAATGIFQTYVILDRGAGNVFYEGSGPDNNTVNPEFQSFYFAPTASAGSFVLKGAEVNTFKNSGGNVTGAALFYRVTPQNGTPGAFVQLNLPFSANTGGTAGNEDQRWQTTAATVDLKAACGTGNVCTLDVYFQAFTNEGNSFDNNGGANYSRPYGVGPFTNAVQNIDATNSSQGYRLLSAPMTGMTVATLAGLNLVQGVTGQYPTAGANLFLQYGGGSTGYVAATAQTQAITPGKGFFWYFYDVAIPADPAGPFGGGTSVSRELGSFTLNAGSNFLAANASVPGSDFVLNGGPEGPMGQINSGLYMVGNPFAYPLRANGITADQELQTNFQAYDPAGLTFRAITGTEALARWQGVFAEVGSPSAAAPTFSFNIQATTAQNVRPSYYRDASAAVPFVVTGTTAEGASVRDEAAIVRLVEGASADWDANDATKLVPPSGPYALLAPMMTRGGAAYRAAVSALPVEAQTVRLAFMATDAGSYSVSWDDLNIPAGWSAQLRDLATGAIVQMNAVTEHAFTSEATDWAERFELVLAQRGAVSTDDAPAEALRVLAARPNPARSTSEVTVELGESQLVRASVYDALGRRVQTLHDGQAAAGSLALSIDASVLAPGVYVVRVEGASAAATQTVTVVR